MTDRIDQKTSVFDWQRFINAVDKIHGVGVGLPRYRDFVTVHVRAMSMAGMSWKVHTMTMGGSTMKGVNFLPWHRWLLAQFERRLQQVDAGVSIPYWDAVKDPQIPAPLADKSLLKRWGVTRDWTPSELPSPQTETELANLGSFVAFQTLLEQDYHNAVHRAVGGVGNAAGDMATSASPNDPLFWLHHANVDRLWAQWQKKHPAAKPTNTTEVMRPKPLFGVTVGSVLSIAALGYQYK